LKIKPRSLGISRILKNKNRHNTKNQERKIQDLRIKTNLKKSRQKETKIKLHRLGPWSYRTEIISDRKEYFEKGITRL
jgi:hypothetical protein